MAQWQKPSPLTNVTWVRFLGHTCCVFCWFSSFLHDVCSGFADFPPCTKTNTSKFQFDLRTVNEEPLSVLEMPQPIPIIIVVVVVFVVIVLLLLLRLLLIIETFSSSRFPPRSKELPLLLRVPCVAFRAFVHGRNKMEECGSRLS